MNKELVALSPEEGAKRFLEHHKPSVRNSSYRNAKHRLSVFLEWCDKEDCENLNNLSGRDLAEFVSWRQPQVAPITVQKQLSTVRQALRWWADIEAVEEGLAEKLHAPKLPDGAESKEVFLDPQHAKAALEYFDKHH